MNINKEVAYILDQSLGLAGRSAQFTRDTALLGSVPELDSMAVATVLTSLEEHFGFTIADDEINAETFTTFGTLTSFVEKKLG